MYHSRDHSPHFELHIGSDCNGLVVGVFGFEPHFALRHTQPFDEQFAIDNGDDDATVLGHERPIHDEHIARVDARARHRIARYAHEKSSRRVSNKVFVQVEPALQIVFGRRREPGRDRFEEDRQLHFGVAFRQYDLLCPCFFVFVLYYFFVPPNIPKEPNSKLKLNNDLAKENKARRPVVFGGEEKVARDKGQGEMCSGGI